MPEIADGGRDQKIASVVRDLEIAPTGVHDPEIAQRRFEERHQ
jgi:hypothetical protein